MLQLSCEYIIYLTMINLKLRSQGKTGMTSNFYFHPIITWLLFIHGAYTMHAANINDTKTRMDDLDNSTCSTDMCIDAAMKISKNLNNSVDPCENFYQHVCGNFGKGSPSLNVLGHVDQFSLISDKVQRQIEELIDKDIEPQEPHTFKLIKTYYRSCLNTTDVELRGLEPLQKILNRLGGWPVILGDAWKEDTFSWERTDQILQSLGYNPRYIFRIFVMQDVKDSSRNILYIGSSESEMKDLWHDDNLMKAYNDFMIDVAVLLGADKNRAELELEEAVTFEKYLINARYSPSAQPEVLYDKVKIKNLRRAHPYVSWLEYFNNVTTYNYQDNDEVYIENPNYLQGVQDLLLNTTQRVIANYMLWRAVYDSVDYLNDRISTKKLLLDRAQTGTTQTQSRGNKCFQAMMNRNEGLLPGISAMYMKNFFNNGSRAKIAKMITGIRKYYENTLKEHSNFSKNMTSTALRKNEFLKEVIGYHEELASTDILEKYYEKLTIEPNNFFENTLNLRKFAYEKGIDRLKKSPNETFWIDVGEAAGVQVFYHAVYNAIVLPASILQYPFFDENQPNYFNYGSTGFLIGHEISHAFLFGENPTDEHGVIKVWWTTEDQANFEIKANCFAEHYDNFTDGTNNTRIGRQTIPENIPDSEGMKAAISAYKTWKAQNGEEKTLPFLNYTGEQLFWISAASLMCTRRTKELTKLLSFTDEHPTEEMRINGAVSNSIDFSKAFKCQLGSRMNPDKKCSFWL